MISFNFVNSDWVLQGNGRLEQVSGLPRMINGIKKILSTDKQNAVNEGDIPFRYNPTYGTNLNFIQALSAIVTVNDAVSTVKTEVRGSITKFAQIQAQQRQLGLDPTEVLVDANVIAFAEKKTTNGVEKISIHYELELKTQDGKAVTLTGTGPTVN